MPSDQNPFESPLQSEPSKASGVMAPIAGLVCGAILGRFSFAQTISTLAFFVDYYAKIGLWFMLNGSAIGLLVGIPLGAIAGWRIGKGRKLDFRFVGIGAAVLCVIFSIPVLVAEGYPKFLVIVSPLFGLVSGAVVGGIVNVLSSHSRS